jgi:protein O-GlcNAc transferase
MAAGNWPAAIGDAETLLASPATDTAGIGLATFALFRGGAKDRAVATLRAAIAQRPDDAVLAGNLGNALQEMGELIEALEWHARAVQLAPANAGYVLNRGIALQAAGRRDEAADSFRRAVELDPANDMARRALGNNLSEAGDIEGARQQYDAVLARRPDPALAIRSALQLPPILPSVDAIPAIRAAFAQAIDGLQAQKLRIGSPSEVGAPSFFLAYHGENELVLQRRLANLYLGACPALSFVAPHCADPNHRQKDGRLRIGFLSANLRTHTIGRLFGGLIGGLDPARFETILFRRPQAADEMSRAIDASVARVVTIPTHLPEAQREIAAYALDVMFYPDIGMDMATFSLAFARLAPVQCVAWGHPLTTGIPSIDYFLSWAGAEPADADRHYSERLIWMQSFPTCYRQPQFDPARVRREHFGIPHERTLYLCLQTLFKFHPAFDAALGAILRGDPKGIVMLIEGQRRRWRQTLVERFRRNIPDVVDRIRFVTSLTNEDYLALTALGDVILDPPFFGGGNTTLEALAAGRPVVTLPGPYLRSRLTQGFLNRIGATRFVARDLTEYAALALQAAGQASKPGTLPAPGSAPLFGQRDTIAEHERFFLAARAAAREGRRIGAWPE